MRVLVACEFSGVVRDAFIKVGHDAMSCDLLPTEAPGPHYQGDVGGILDDGWDMMIAHPPCTYLTWSSNRWMKDRLEEQRAALDFVRLLLDAPIHHIALENPSGVINRNIRPPDCITHPWMHGHGETKLTCLWLKNLPNLQPTNEVDGRDSGHYKITGKNRGHKRSITYTGIAAAMAAQWPGNGRMSDARARITQ